MEINAQIIWLLGVQPLERQKKEEKKIPLSYWEDKNNKAGTDNWSLHSGNESLSELWKKRCLFFSLAAAADILGALLNLGKDVPVFWYVFIYQLFYVLSAFSY